LKEITNQGYYVTEYKQNKSLMLLYSVSKLRIYHLKVVVSL